MKMEHVKKGLIISIITLLLVVLMNYGTLSAAATKSSKHNKTATITNNILPGSMAEKAPKPHAAFDVDNMSDMTDFDPATWVSPKGDTIKIAYVAPFSGPAAKNSFYYWCCLAWVAHDLNKRGGVLVDGKRKLIEIIKADNMARQDQTRKICERMALQEKVHFFWGTPGSHLTKIMNEVADKYKIIAVNAMSVTDDIMSANNFSRYSFMSSWSVEQIGRSFGYYYGQIRKKEKKFYILSQDYSLGHDTAEAFKKGLKEFYPESQIAGEDYHKLFLTDFAPYLQKINSSDAEVIFTSDWDPDVRNLFKQLRQMNIFLPVAAFYLDIPDLFVEIGIEKTKGLVLLNNYNISNPFFKNSKQIKFYKAWNDQWRNKWKSEPYNNHFFEHPSSYLGAWVMNIYWMFSVVERAKSTDPEKIIKVWEGDTYQFVNGETVMMRACDHKMIQDLGISEFVPPAEQKVSFNIPPYYWLKDASSYGRIYTVPAAKILPWMDQKLDRCKGKNNWGE